MSHENMLRVPLHGQSLGCSTTIHFLTLKRPEMILKMLWGTLRCSLIASAFPSTLYHNTQLWDLVQTPVFTFSSNFDAQAIYTMMGMPNSQIFNPLKLKKRRLLVAHQRTLPILTQACDCNISELCFHVQCSLCGVPRFFLGVEIHLSLEGKKVSLGVQVTNFENMLLLGDMVSFGKLEGRRIQGEKKGTAKGKWGNNKAAGKREITLQILWIKKHQTDQVSSVWDIAVALPSKSYIIVSFLTCHLALLYYCPAFSWSHPLHPRNTSVPGDLDSLLHERKSRKGT